MATIELDSRQRSRAAFARRCKARGLRNLCVRVPASVLDRLEALVASSGTSRRDVIERLILADPLQAAMAEHRMSEAEARAFVEGLA